MFNVQIWKMKQKPWCTEFLVRPVKFETVESSLYLCSILLQKYFLSMWNFAGFGTDFAYCGLRSTDYKVPTKSQGQSRLYIQIALLIYFCMNEYNAGGVLEKDQSFFQFEVGKVVFCF